LASRKTSLVPSTSEQLAEIVKDARAMREAARGGIERAKEAVRRAQDTLANIRTIVRFDQK